jgi:hypothetical protein
LSPIQQLLDGKGHFPSKQGAHTSNARRSLRVCGDRNRRLRRPRRDALRGQAREQAQAAAQDWADTFNDAARAKNDLSRARSWSVELCDRYDADRYDCVSRVVVAVAPPLDEQGPTTTMSCEVAVEVHDPGNEVYREEKCV